MVNHPAYLVYTVLPRRIPKGNIMMIRFETNSVVHLSNVAWGYLDTMGPDGSLYRQHANYVAFTGHGEEDLATWIFRLYSQAKMEILSMFLQDAPDLEGMTCLAGLMVDLDPLLNVQEGALLLFWLTGAGEDTPDMREKVAALDRGFQKKRRVYHDVLGKLKLAAAGKDLTNPPPMS